MRVSRRLALTLLALGAVGAVVAGATFAVFQSQAQSQSPGFAVGSVRLDTTGGSGGCTLSNLKPGEGSTGLGGTLSPCTYSVTYRGTLAGWVGLNVTVEPQSGGLYTGGTGGLTLQVTDAYGNTFTVGGLDQLVRVPIGASDANGDGSVNAGWQDTFTVNYYLPSTASGSLADKSSTVTLWAHAVQESNDPLNASAECPVLGWGGSATAGSACGGASTSGSGAAGSASGTCQSLGGDGVVHGCTQGYWHNQNGIRVISSDGVNLNTPVTLGQGARSVTLTTVAESQDVLPSNFGVCLASLLNCGNSFSDSVTATTLGHLASQTLALAYSGEYVQGLTPETLSTLGCATYDGDAAMLGLTGATTVGQLLTRADALIGGSTSTGPTTNGQVTAMTDLLGSCVLL